MQCFVAFSKIISPEQFCRRHTFRRARFPHDNGQFNFRRSKTIGLHAICFRNNISNTSFCFPRTAIRLARLIIFWWRQLFAQLPFVSFFAGITVWKVEKSTTESSKCYQRWPHSRHIIARSTILSSTTCKMNSMVISRIDNYILGERRLGCKCKWLYLHDCESSPSNWAHDHLLWNAQPENHCLHEIAVTKFANTKENSEVLSNGILLLFGVLV